MWAILFFLKIGKKSLQLLMNCVIMHIVDSVLVKEWGDPLFGFYYGNLPQHCFSRWAKGFKLFKLSFKAGPMAQAFKVGTSPLGAILKSKGVVCFWLVTRLQGLQSWCSLR